MAALASDWLRHFSTSSLKPQNRIQRNFDSKQDLNVLYQVCVFQADRKNKMAVLASDWLRPFDLSSETTERNSTKLYMKQDLNVLYQVCVFFGPIGKTRWPPWLLLAETFSTLPLKPLNRIQRNLTRSKFSTSSTKFVFFLQIEKTRWPPLPLNGLDIFDFSSETAEWISKQHDRKQDLIILYQICILRADQ